MYDLQESPLAWNKVLHKKLEEMKFKIPEVDPCAYVKYDKEGNMYLSVHVDESNRFNKGMVWTKYWKSIWNQQTGQYIVVTWNVNREKLCMAIWGIILI